MGFEAAAFTSRAATDHGVHRGWRGGDETDRLREQNPAGWSSRPGHAGSAFESPLHGGGGAGSPDAVATGGPLLVDVWCGGRGLETSGSAALTVPGRRRGRRRSRTIQSCGVLHSQELGSPAATRLPGPPWVGSCRNCGSVAGLRHSASHPQVRPCCGRCPCVLVYGCDVPLCRWTPPSSICRWAVGWPPP